MSVVRSHRSLIAWLLYACVLFSALACSINHGQQSGLALNGVGGLFCSADNHAGAALKSSFSESKSYSVMPNLGCPLCSAVTLSIAALLCLSWLLRPTGKTFVLAEPAPHTSPRCIWPPANPRAP